jgi:hypothetical protein
MLKPINGETNSEINIFHNPATRMACVPAAITTAPTRPPMSAWEELLGNPRNPVSRFHRMAPSMAARITCVLISVGLTTTLPIVFATAIPKIKGPKNSATAVIPWAARMDMAREEIIVATMLLESLTPFRNAYKRAKKITPSKVGDTNSIRYQVILTTISAITLAASSPRSAALLK